MSVSRTLFSWAYGLIAKVPRPPGKAYLQGNFGPVEDEKELEELEVVEGKLPDGLEGCYVRNGPNPFYKPVAGYHWFDGDGMLHLVRLKDGKASYCNRYVATERLKQVAPPLPPTRRFRLARIFGPLDNSKGSGNANTALTYHAGRLLALNEADLPYAVRILCSGLVETMGRLQLGKSWRNNFTAHPKRDPQNGELMFIGYQMDAKPYVSAGILDKHGNLTRQWVVQIPRPVMMHDMAATERFIVILDLPLCFDLKVMIKDKAMPIVLRKEIPSRIGLLRRDQPSRPEGYAEVQWFELPGPGFMAFHVVNSWDDDNGDVKIFACQMDNVDLSLDSMKSEQLAHLTEYTLSPSTGTASIRRLSELLCDFPVVHPNMVTHPCQWSWVAVHDASSSLPAFNGIAKMNLAAPPGSDACVAKVNYPPGVLGGEAVFVPRNGAVTEDDGFLVAYVHDTKTDTSYMNIYDARTMASKPMASLLMPRRVPYGFHGTWVSEEKLKKQVHWF
ncbi:hypothetical protein VOLCADRAFT_85861 [Volvox carteri f. nagariensis]|uniref:carotenoid 9,10-dioxygenase n=1 Tax=Volvox carteri f. nagariensis TaxID=3068 RepID=D8TH69_VOLCA|nr:uncharacterized protein VOLCADRAFT_85861 [Volvox carteri f. nagariensis]EFJ52660.1 hypothetical protein VOLCADRAFT_85861 [Volvox carteri f. nagariensis]|eukprot:XP_002945665.1 hypothetical protein VOLCADRAFT_85861 [Volvox carteri f. nagariensis]